MLNIPRDTCWNGDKINAANAQGGGPRRRPPSAASSVCR